MVTEMGKGMREGCVRERGMVRASEDDDEGGGESPHTYKNAREELLAEFGNELIGGYGKGKKRLPATLTRSECRELMSAYSKGKWAFRNNLIIRVMYVTGVRLDEEAGLNVADIGFEGKTVFVRLGKEGKDRYTCADEETLALLKTWIGGKGPGDSVFDLSDRQIARIVEEAGEITGIAAKYEGMDRRFSPHSLRHSFATHCYENGMKLFTLKKLMGHEFLGTTLIYVETAMKFEVEEYMRAGPMGPAAGR
jgi:site-specific recombinase XerD